MSSSAPERWVVNASPVILLAKAGVIHHLPALCRELVIPKGVVDEVGQGRAADLGRHWLSGEGLRFIRPSPALHPALSTWGGGVGEAAVISWALANPGFTAVLDDRAARQLATQHGVPIHESSCSRRSAA